MHWLPTLVLCAAAAQAVPQKEVPPERDARLPQNRPAAPVLRERPAAVQDRRDALVDPAKQLRVLARHVADLEAAHRSKLARIERLVDIYTGLGDSAKVQQCEELRARWNKRYKGALNAYKKSFEPEAWERLLKALGVVEPA